KQATADVEIDAGGDLLSLATLHIASPDTTPLPPVAATPANNTGPTNAGPSVVGLRRGRAVVSGRVSDMMGRPLVGANLSVDGPAPTTEAGADGTFTLRGLPAGTQALVVRKVVFAPTRVAVDLSNITPRR